MQHRTLRSFYATFFILMAAMLFSFGSYAQQEPLYTQYMYNIGSFNPGYVGSVQNTELSTLYRAQWLDVEGTPRTFRLGANVPLSNETMGLGLNIVNDQIGPSTQTYIDLSYSYQLKVTDNTKLSFGMDLGGSFLNVDFSKGTFENPGEPILGGETISNFYPTVGAGFFLYEDDIWYMGASIPNFLTDGIYNNEVASIIDEKLQFNFIGGYVFDFNETLKFKPAFLISLVSGAPVNTNLSANFLYNNRFTMGASYRFGNAISGLAGFQVTNSAFIGYSYDYSTNPLGEFSSSSHEIILKFYLGRGDGTNSNKELKGKPKQIDTPRFF